MKKETIKFKPEYEKELLRLGVKNRIEHCEREEEDIFEINQAYTFYDFMLDSFEWSKTPEGAIFWSDILNGIKPKEL